jgi:crotonobetainyl-CoA:carnitine CoA-transferase CaiB-like acyl-CoA transferase
MSYDLLSGVKVIEVSLYAFAPASTAVLSDWGADVIKVVPPQIADPMMGTPVAGLPKKDVDVAFMWELLNRGKRCMGINIATSEGREVLLSLVRQADVFVTNLLPDARRRFGIEPADLQTENPRLVYARASAHGAEGPEREAGGYDHTDFWARSGIGHSASQVADEFVPQPGPAMGDLAAGMSLAGAVAAALFRRERTGRGGIVDVSLLSTALWLGAPAIMAAGIYGVDTIPRMRHQDLPNPLVAAYATRDGRLIYLAGIQTESHFENFCELVERDDLLKDERFVSGEERLANRSELIAELDQLFASRDLAEWVECLQGLSTPWTVVQTASEALNDRQVVANGFVPEVLGASPYPVVASPAQIDEVPLDLRAAPAHGEHTEEVLTETGYSWESIIDLKVKDAVL